MRFSLTLSERKSPDIVMLRPPRVIIAALTLAISVGFTLAPRQLLAFDFASFSPAAKPTPETITAAIAALGKDKVSWNFAIAFNYLMKNRQAALPFLIAALPNKDGQREHGILRVLVGEPSFQPTRDQLDLFYTHIVSRVWQDDDYLIGQPTKSLRYDFIPYLVEQANAYKPALSSHLNSEDAFTMWVTTFILSQANVLDEFRQQIETKTLARLAENLRNDKRSYNATYAVRTFLILGAQGVPILKKSSTSRDVQERELSKRLLAYMQTRDALILDQIGSSYAPPEAGYLCINKKGQLAPASVWKERYLVPPGSQRQWDELFGKWWERRMRAWDKWSGRDYR
jgi:hypothetical protein